MIKLSIPDCAYDIIGKCIGYSLVVPIIIIFGVLDIWDYFFQGL